MDSVFAKILTLPVDNPELRSVRFFRSMRRMKLQLKFNCVLLKDLFSNLLQTPRFRNLWNIVLLGMTEMVEHFPTHLSFQQGLSDKEYCFSNCAEWSEKAPYSSVLKISQLEINQATCVFAQLQHRCNACFLLC